MCVSNSFEEKVDKSKNICNDDSQQFNWRN